MIKQNPFVPFSIAMVTPFDDKENLSLSGIYSLIDYYKKNQVPALLISGSTGEQHSMSIEERITLLREARLAGEEKLLLIGGVAAVRTSDAIRLAEAAQRENLDGIMLGFPPYLRMSQREAAEYVKKVCAVTDLPIMLYNNPSRTGFNLELTTLYDLVESCPQIQALKEAGNPSNAPLVKNKLGPSFSVLTGFDIHLLDNMQNGYDGITSIIGNIFPKEIQQIVQLGKNNEWKLAEDQLSKLLPTMHTILEIGTLRAIKYVLTENNINAGICREPLSILSKQEKASLSDIFNKGEVR
ncbi:dihydrodipicolinate synthase family protein [Niallia sp. Sow4_A1]|jgi:4-hydroxy-tetrahydrodipicolinate synthase|uniref:Dihydrodipicolinate synthase family protein n=1 Tax=Niallia hominis TaxID=3133173 RepID=A0ABV1F537_9BACI|nr:MULTISPECIES: dihydrodipicolinate synthase family protein [Bacillaceae]MCF2647167.1 dihydrodipicolinate synthase family protein [Niallia circulans]MCM3361428.1 dihydrodipicolinate synthase family protein [Niallia sp. MER TA 168]CAI9395841.1 4-hydroxy-tetrahydrodipicolinate synthase [Bacillus sp. T2.9-1]